MELAEHFGWIPKVPFTQQAARWDARFKDLVLALSADVLASLAVLMALLAERLSAKHKWGCTWRRKL